MKSAETTASDTTLPATPIFPIPDIGSLERNVSLPLTIDDTTAYFNEYTSINDFISKRYGTFVLDLGSVGQYGELMFGGIGGRRVAYLHDDILLNEPLTGTYNPYWFQTEQIRKVEVEAGTRAFLYSLNSTGGVVNMVTEDYKAIRPLTRIRYSESLYEQTYFDGMFSQNLTRNLNLTGGVQRHVTDGRYRNSNFDMWGARIRARYNVNNRLNLFVSENYAQSQLGLYGGIDYLSANPASIFDPLQTTIVSNDAYEKITRHDVRIGAAATLLEDTSAVTTLTAYYSSHFRELRDENNRQGADTFFIFDNHHLHWQGVRLTQNFAGDFLSLNFGGEIQSRQVIESPATGYRADVASSVFAKTEATPIPFLNIAGYARVDHYANRTRFSFGADGTLRPTPWLDFFAGYSQSFRFPTFQELYWRRGNINAVTASLEPERHHLAETGFRLQWENWLHFNARLYRRIVDDYIGTLPSLPRAPFPGIQFVTDNNVTFTGIDLSGTVRVWYFVAEGYAHYLKSPAASPGRGRTNLMPEWWGGGGVYFWERLLNNNLHLKVGIRGRAYGEQLGMEFNPEAMMFVPSSLPPLGVVTVADGVVIAKIGRAYVHFIWQNLFANEYVLVPYYPMPDRAVQFGITWELLD